MFPPMDLRLLSTPPEVISPLTVLTAHARALGIVPDQLITRLRVPGAGFNREYTAITPVRPFTAMVNGRKITDLSR